MDKHYAARFLRHRNELDWLFMELYDDRNALTNLYAMLEEAYNARSEELRALDIEREAKPEWYRESRMYGMTMYSDLFAGGLKGVMEKLPDELMADGAAEIATHDKSRVGAIGYRRSVEGHAVALLPSYWAVSPFDIAEDGAYAVFGFYIGVSDIGDGHRFDGELRIYACGDGIGDRPCLALPDRAAAVKGHRMRAGDKIVFCVGDRRDQSLAAQMTAQVGIECGYSPFVAVGDPGVA